MIYALNALFQRVFGLHQARRVTLKHDGAQLKEGIVQCRHRKANSTMLRRFVVLNSEGEFLSPNSMASKLTAARIEQPTK